MLKQLLKAASSLAFAFLLLILVSNQASASEGDIILRNTQGGPSRCAVRSVLTTDYQYTVLITCRELIYPANPELLSYMVWAQPLDGSTAFRMGELGVGKVMFKTKIPFASIFVTQERDKNVKTPNGTVIMRGSVTSISSIENPSQAPLPSEEPVLTPAPTNRPGILGNIFRTGTLVLVVSVFIIILMLVLVKPFK